MHEFALLTNTKFDTKLQYKTPDIVAYICLRRAILLVKDISVRV